MIGRVVSTKMKDTAVVLITSTKKHPLYKKTYKRSKKFLAHDELGVILGDVIEIVPVKPLSRKKFWKVSKVVGRQFEAVAKEDLKNAAKEAIAEVMPEEKREESSDISHQTSDNKTEEKTKKKTKVKRKEKSES